MHNQNSPQQPQPQTHHGQGQQGDRDDDARQSSQHQGGRDTEEE